VSRNQQILVADDEPNLRRVLEAQLRRDGFDVIGVEDGRAALEALAEHHVDVVITDLRMPHVDGMALLKHVVAEFPRVPVIMITAHGTVDTAVEALKLGAFDYITKPFDRDELKSAIRKAARTRELSQTTASNATAVGGRFRIIGQSPKMTEVFDVIERVADTPSTVLVTGESGTGKELVARALHEYSRRAKKPFVRVNCAAIPTELLEAELFGYERGAFTGAVTSKPGRFELAHEGTLFLDEIAEIPPSMQVKLLRALQEQEFERVGGIKTIRVDVRLVAATNRNLEVEIREGRFREDLYYRLNVVHVELPPLRERQGDIPLLLGHFVDRYNERLGRNVTGFSEEAQALLAQYDFPGNIRELENLVERCLLFCDGDRVEVEHLPESVRRARARRAGEAVPSEPPSYDEILESDENTGLKDMVREATTRMERAIIERALEKTGGNVTHAARLLRISRKSLQIKMKELNLRE
jgi:two-component system response regulator AtoC